MPTVPRPPSVSLRLSGHVGPDPAPVTGLVVEGGGARGVFCAGVLDALAASSTAPFDVALGSSAGALVLAAHLAGQRGMAVAAYTDHMLRPGIVDRRRFLRGGPLFDLDTLWDEMHRDQPLDLPALVGSPTRFRVVVTDVSTGEAHHLAPDDETWSLLKASCALPLLYGRSVAVGGREYIDGGYSDPLPVHQARAMGAASLLVVRTRPLDVAGDTGPGAWGGRGLVTWSLRRNRVLSQQVGRSRTRYATSLEFARNPPDGTLVLEVAPSRPLASGSSTSSRTVLERDYELGVRAGTSAAAVWAGLRTGEGVLAGV